MGANDDLDVAVFDFRIKDIKGVGFGIVGVETSNTSFGEEFDKFCLEEFGAKTFVNNGRVVTFWARRGDFGGIATGVTEERIGVGMQGER